MEKYHRTASQVEGIGVFEVIEEATRLHQAAFSADPVLANALTPAASTPTGSAVTSNTWTPDAIAKLQH